MPFLSDVVEAVFTIAARVHIVLVG